MFRSLTDFQKQLIKDYEKLATEVYFHGIDENRLPVISFKDSTGMRGPFAVLHRPRKTFTAQKSYGSDGRAIRHLPVERTTTEPAYPVRDFTEEELDFMDMRSLELISGLKHA